MAFLRGELHVHIHIGTEGKVDRLLDAATNFLKRPPGLSPADEEALRDVADTTSALLKKVEGINTAPPKPLAGSQHASQHANEE